MVFRNLKFSPMAKITTATFTLIFLAVGILIISTKGVVIYQSHLYKEDEWSIQMDGRLLLKATMSPRPTICKDQYAYPRRVEEISPFGFLTVAHDAGADLRLKITSDRIIKTAVVDELVVRDSRGVEKPGGLSE